MSVNLSFSDEKHVHVIPLNKTDFKFLDNLSYCGFHIRSERKRKRERERERERERVRERE